MKGERIIKSFTLLGQMLENPNFHCVNRFGRTYAVMAQSQDQYTCFISQGNRGCAIRPYCKYHSRGDSIFNLCGKQKPNISDSKNYNEHIRDIHSGKKKDKQKKGIKKKISLY